MSDVIHLSTSRPGPFATPRTTLIGRYLIRNPAKAVVMAGLDACLALLPARRSVLPDQPGAILFANWAHLGDLTATLGAVRLVRERFPKARIGYLASSWGQAAAAKSGLIDTIHIVDHARMNRTTEDQAAKDARHRATLMQAGAEIRAAGYDVAIDFYCYFPPAHPLFWRWGIPIRAGFDSAGWGPCLTHPVRWRDRNQPISAHYDDLLEALWPGIVPAPDALRPQLDPVRIGSLPALLEGAHPYLVVHPGAGALFKDWGQEHWQVLLDALARHPRFREYRIVLTGAGPSEAACTAALAAGRTGVVDMAGRADWAEFVAVVAGAEAVICPDTVTGHIAAQVGTPVVSLFTGTNNPHQWAPNAACGRVLTVGVACAPCYRPGCKVMACVRDIPPAAVVAALEEMLAPASG